LVFLRFNAFVFRGESGNVRIPHCISLVDNRLLACCVAEVVAYNVPLYAVIVLLFFAILSTLAFLERVDGGGVFCKR
jgi:hypothetical protein